MTEIQKDPTTHIQLSKASIDLLRNFSTINKSILIEPGKMLQTMSVNKNIIAMGQIGERIPEQMSIYDLPLFLGALSLFKKPWLHFPDNKKVIIYDEDTKGKTVFYYSDPEIIVRPPDFNPNLPQVEIMFDLPQTDTQQLLQAAKVYGVEDLCINGYANEYSICVRDKKNNTSNSFDITVGETESEFAFNFKVENIKILPGAYDITCSQKNISKFNHKTLDLVYFIALEPDSTFD